MINDALSSPPPAGASVCPPVALDLGVDLMCRLCVRWQQVPAGVLVLTQWLLGDEDADQDSGLVRGLGGGSFPVPSSGWCTVVSAAVVVNDDVAAFTTSDDLQTTFNTQSPAFVLSHHIFSLMSSSGLGRSNQTAKVSVCS